MFLCRDRGLWWRPPPPLHQREVARHIPRATHRSGFPNVSLHMLTPLKRASVPSVQSSTTNRVHHCFSQSPQYIFGFSPYVCSGHIERVVRGVELGDNCGGWPGAPRTPPRPAADTLECGHGRRTWTAAVFGLDHCQAFTFDQNPVFKKPDVGTGEALIRAGEQKPSHFPDSLW